MADQRRIDIVVFAAVEIPADPSDLDATIELKKIRKAGESLQTKVGLKDTC